MQLAFLSWTLESHFSDVLAAFIEPRCIGGVVPPRPFLFSKLWNPPGREPHEDVFTPAPAKLLSRYVFFLICLRFFFNN
ncbi:hypothetical protein C8J57DRAFT_1302032 [Mycena rebaudengoi]|jgi:hypothetical protein|nr:hypothetical protein C8J57DRAFT_1302032 [Mycena rebaudengoi]